MLQCMFFVALWSPAGKGLISWLSYSFPKCCLVHIRIKGEDGAINSGLSPPVKYFTDRSKSVLLLWIFYVFFCVCYAFCARLFICALCSPAGKGLTSWLSFVVSNCEFVTFPCVVRDCIDS